MTQLRFAGRFIGIKQFGQEGRDVVVEQAEELIDEEPEDGAAGAEIPSQGALSLSLVPARLSIGPTRVLLNWRLDITNIGQTHIVALKTWSDLVSAHSSVPSDEQLGGPDAADARPQTIPVLAPGASANLVGEWQLARDAVRPVDNAPDRLILPLARFRFVGAGMLPFRMAFIIGNPPKPGDDRLRALHLDGGLQIHSRLAARAVA